MCKDPKGRFIELEQFELEMKTKQIKKITSGGRNVQDK